MKSDQEKVEYYVKHKLRLRGFTEDQIMNNRGLIGAMVDEMLLYEL